MSITRQHLRAMYLEIERQKNISKVQEFVDKITTVIIGSNSSGQTCCYVARPFADIEFTQQVIDLLKNKFVDSEIGLDDDDKIKIEWTIQ
jgi:hypothetical protein